MDLNRVTPQKIYAYYFPGRSPFYQTFCGQSQESELHARPYSLHIPIYRQRGACTPLQSSRPSTRGVCVKCVVAIQVQGQKTGRKST